LAPRFSSRFNAIRQYPQERVMYIFTFAMLF